MEPVVGRRGFTIWLTGLSGAGKTTISTRLGEVMAERSVACERLDGDTLRQTLCKDLGFSTQDRWTNILRIGFVAKMLSRHGVCVIVSAISPYRAAREEVMATIPDFVEVYVKCPIAICEQRDVKGLYRKARNGMLERFTGIGDCYEEPHQPAIVCDTEIETVEESVDKIISGLLLMGLL